MCTRYYMELSPELRPYIETAVRSPLKDRLITRFARPLITEGEVRPGDIAPVIASDRNRQKSAFPMIFGFPVKTGGLVLNARSETAADKIMFKEALSRRRCIIPASWYYEWQHFVMADGKKKTGDKYMFQPEGEKAAWLCGLYRIEDGIPYFVILTKDAAGALKSIHDRMPLILPSASIDSWIDPESDPMGLMKMTINNVVYEKAE